MSCPIKKYVVGSTCGNVPEKLRAISEYIEQDRNLETANRVARAICEAIVISCTAVRNGLEGSVALFAMNRPEMHTMPV